MRILYCLELLECKYVSEVSEFWIYCEDIKFSYAKVCFIDSCGDTFISEKMAYSYALNCLDKITRQGYLCLENTLFEIEEEE